MTESAWPLRLALLVLGLLVIAGVYGFSVWRRRQWTRRIGRRAGGAYRSRTRQGRPEPEPDTGDEPGEDDFVVIPVKPRDRLDELPVIRREPERGSPAAAEPAAAPARPARTTRPRRRKDQLSLALEPEAPEAPAAPPEPEVVAIYVRPAAGASFRGPAIVEATAEVGMRYGDMRIYHHYGAGDLRTRGPLFSVANMFEPGAFDLEAMADFSTEGLALFLRLPAELDGPVAFELFLSTAQRFAAALGGTLYRDPAHELDNATIERMRRLAARYGHGRT